MLPKSVQPKVKAALHEIWTARRETKLARRPTGFWPVSGAKYPEQPLPVRVTQVISYKKIRHELESQRQTKSRERDERIPEKTKRTHRYKLEQNTPSEGLNVNLITTKARYNKGLEKNRIQVFTLLGLVNLYSEKA